MGGEAINGGSPEPRGLGAMPIPPSLVAGLVALKIVILFVLAWNSRFVTDEFVQFGWAKHLGNGLFETIWPAKAVGSAIFYKLAHLIGWDATSMLLIGRMQTALLGCATLAVIYACARALGENRLRSLVIVLVLLSFSNFSERIFRTITEPLAVFFAAMALMIVLRGRADRARTLLAAGVFCGLAFLATQKSIYFNVALGLALVGDAALARSFVDAIRRGALLVLGWAVPIAVYCLAFGGSDPASIVQHLFVGPVPNATSGADPYGSLRFYVGQTLQRNALLYIFCFAGMAASLWRIAKLDGKRRIALIFSLVITALVFTHNQPWPYVFIMALPFMALWSLTLFDRIAANPRQVRMAYAVLAVAVVIGLVQNILYLRIHNRGQLDLVERAEVLVAPGEPYFDGVGMLPNRPEPTTLWLDRASVLSTLANGPRSDAYRSIAETPTKVILWSYRMDAIYPVIAPLLENSYVGVSPNIRIAGRRLRRGVPTRFDVPIGGQYALYGTDGKPLRDTIEVDGRALVSPIRLTPGTTMITLRSGPGEAWLLPKADYAGPLGAGSDDDQLFANVYE